jgi:hypothetical protein
LLAAGSSGGRLGRAPALCSSPTFPRGWLVVGGGPGRPVVERRPWDDIGLNAG